MTTPTHLPPQIAATLTGKAAGAAAAAAAKASTKTTKVVVKATAPARPSRPRYSNLSPGEVPRAGGNGLSAVLILMAVAILGWLSVK